MQRWSASRGQVEPLAALVAVMAVCAGITMYAGVAVEFTHQGEDRSVADPTLDRVSADFLTDGSIDPSEISDKSYLAPRDHKLAITVETPQRKWDCGKSAPSTAESASKPVSVQVDRGIIETGTLTVEVWNA